MEDFVLDYGALGVVIVAMFWWFQSKTNANHKAVERAQSDIDEHKASCGSRYEESAKQTAILSTTMSQVADTIRKIDKLTQETHDRLIKIEAERR